MHWKMTFRVLFTATAIAGVVVSARTSSGVEPVETDRVALRSVDEAKADGSFGTKFGHRFVGVGGCSAANCHGGDGTKGTVGSEYSIWIQDDKHAEAYSVLYNETSQRMAKLLKLDKPAHQAALCLNCHAPQNDHPFSGEHAHQSLSALLDGVSCEACHGAASDWLGPHVRRDWAKKPPEEKAALGFRETKNLWNRSKVCADCHVGEPGRDVNHDLYAAGHPRLFFEMSAFHANMPAHWDRNDDRGRTGPDRDQSSFEAKLWAIGQLASAEAALDLLVHRAENTRDDFVLRDKDAKYPSGETVAVWPEFAETGCFACHHNLDSPSWRQKRDTLLATRADIRGVPGCSRLFQPWSVRPARMISPVLAARFQN